MQKTREEIEEVARAIAGDFRRNMAAARTADKATDGRLTFTDLIAETRMVLDGHGQYGDEHDRRINSRAFWMSPS